MSVPGAPVLVVIGGPTGVGKSTLVNAVVRRSVCDVDVVRPTTRVPCVVRHPEDPPPTAVARGGASVVTDPGCPRGVALVDSPDIDSVETSHKDVADALMDAADVWVAVLSPGRYADRRAWEALRRAATAAIPTAVVLSRVDEKTRVTVPLLAAMMREEGLEHAPLVVVPESSDAAGLLPREATADVRRMLRVLAEHPEARAEIRASRAARR